MASIAALLLAAGESTRMGELKALLPWHGETLFQHQVNALSSAGILLTIVVLGHEAERLQSLLELRPGLRCVYNPDFRQGKTTSIKAGLRSLCEDKDSCPRPGGDVAILVLNVDQPRSAETIRQIITLHFSGSGPAGPTHLITVPTYQGRGGHPLVLSTSLIPELIEISEDSLGLKTVVRRHVADTYRVEIDRPEILLDLNTPNDYRTALGTISPG